jgi:hypothetical protein
MRASHTRIIGVFGADERYAERAVYGCLCVRAYEARGNLASHLHPCDFACLAQRRSTRPHTVGVGTWAGVNRSTGLPSHGEAGTTGVTSCTRLLR